MTWEIKEEDKAKSLTLYKLNAVYKEIRDNGNKDPEYYHMMERYYMELYIYQIAEKMLKENTIQGLAVIFRKIHAVDYPRWFA
jgi:hypothetical protein